MQYKKIPKNRNITTKGAYKMKKGNRKIKENENFMDIKRLSEKYIMLSTCLSAHNIRKVLSRTIRDNIILNNCNSGLNDWLGSINGYKITNIEEYEQLLREYNSQFFNYPTAYIDNFIKFASSDLIRQIVKLSYIASGRGRKSVPINNANIKNRNLVFTFNSKVFVEHVKDEKEIPFYANAFWHFVMLIFLTEYVNSYTNETITLNLSEFHNFISLNILTGMKMSVEFETDVLYEELFEEISKFIPSNKKNIVITVNDEKQTILFRVKNNFILADAFKNEGYKKVKSEFNKELDRKSESELRVKHGNTPNSIELILYVTGMRTISRILSLDCNPLNKIYLRNFVEKGGFFISLIISFHFRAIVQNSSLITFDKSHYTTYSKFITRYKGERNTALKTAVIILLSKLPNNKRKILIDKCFKKDDYRVKNDIYMDLENLDKILNQDKFCATARFHNVLRRDYGW